MRPPAQLNDRQLVRAILELARSRPSSGPAALLEHIENLRALVRERRRRRRARSA